MRFLYQIQLSDLTLQKYKYYFIRPNKHSAYKRYSNNKTQYKKNKASQIFETPYGISHFCG